MQNSAIELHDSVITAMRTDDDAHVVIDIEAYVHVSDGQPGVDPGTGWSRTVQMTVFEGAVSRSFEGRDLRVYDGTVTVGSRRFENTLPLVDETERVEMTLTFGGEVDALSVTGTRLRVEPVGDAVFVEEFTGRGAKSGGANASECHHRSRRVPLPPESPGPGSLRQKGARGHARG